VRRLGIGLAAATLALTSLLAGQTHSTSAASSWRFGMPNFTPHHGDWFIAAYTAYDVGTDLYAMYAAVSGPGFIGGSPTDVDLGCAVLHNWNPATMTFSTGQGIRVDADAGITPPPTYDSGFGVVSGANVLSGFGPNGSTSVYAAEHAGGQNPDYYVYLFPTGQYPFYTQGTVTTSGWLHFNNTIIPSPITFGTRYPDSGTLTISLRGVMANLTGPSNPLVPTSFTNGALQCSIAGQPIDRAGLALFGDVPEFEAGAF
jgi:hypothetical protein